MESAFLEEPDRAGVRAGRPGLGAGARWTPRALTREAGPAAGRMSPAPVAVLAAFLLRVFTLAGDTGVRDVGPLAEAGGSDWGRSGLGRAQEPS